MDLTEGLILSSMMGNGGGSGGGGGNPGYHVETQTVTIIPQQTVQCTDDGNDGFSAVPLSNVTIDASYTNPITFIYDGVTYPDVERFPGPDAFWAVPDDNVDLFEFGYNPTIPGWIFWTYDANSHTLEAVSTTKSVVVSENFQKARGYGNTKTEYVPEQTVTGELEGEQYVAFIADTISPSLASYEGALSFVFNGTVYDNVPYVEEGEYWMVTNESDEPVFAFYKGDGGELVTTQATNTIQAYSLDPFVTDEFSEAVNSCVDIPEPSTPESPLPDADGLIRNFLVTDSRGEGTIGWVTMSWDQFSPSIGGNVTTAYRNRYLKIESYSFEGEVATLRINLSNKQITAGNIATQAILPIYSPDGLEIVFKIGIDGQAVVLYDKGTTATGKYGYGSVIVLPR